MLLRPASMADEDMDLDDGQDEDSSFLAQAAAAVRYSIGPAR